MESQNNLRKKRLRLNTVTSLTLQITTIVCGFILPRLILNSFGSDINGLVNSINQFLCMIAFLELGVGAVVQSSLYKPLAETDNESISKIYVSASKFFRTLAYILVVYIIILIFLFPTFVSERFDFIFTTTLIIAMSISSFAQYYFGVVDRLLMTADQRGYIQYMSQIFTLVLNTIACVILINYGASIQVVKLATSLIFLLRPIVLRIIVNKKYNINRKIKYTSEPIKQKWNGVAQHIAAVILDGTDIIVLTLLASLAEVSIYSIYNLVTYGVKQLFISMTNGFQALIGELWARQELIELENYFAKVEWSIHTGVVFVFGCTASLIVPFVQVYTLGVNDADYYVPIFALLITIANAMHCLRLPYNIIILAGGHYKQTQHNYIIAALMNVIVSVVTVKLFGLIGVAIGTMSAMLYQTIWMMIYNSNNFFNWPIKRSVKQMAVDVLTFCIAYVIANMIAFDDVTVIGWLILAVKKSIIWGVIVIIMNAICYRTHVKSLIYSLTKRASR